MSRHRTHLCGKHRSTTSWSLSGAGLLGGWRYSTCQRQGARARHDHEHHHRSPTAQATAGAAGRRVAGRMTRPMEHIG